MPILTKFNDIIPAVTKMTGKKTSEFIESLTQELIDTTPVCTGYAQASWYATPQAVKTKNEVAYPGNWVKCDGRIPRKEINLTRYDKIYGEWFIVNLAPYISDLNEGSSKQRDVGWIEDIITKHALKGLNFT